MTKSNSPILREIALSLRMLLRHTLTADIGTGVPKTEVAQRIKAIDVALGEAPIVTTKTQLRRMDGGELGALVDFVKPDKKPAKKVAKKPAKKVPKKSPLGCSVEGCDGKHKAKGLCSKHYWKTKRSV